MEDPRPFVIWRPCPACGGVGRAPPAPACGPCQGTGAAEFLHGTKADLAPGDLLEPGRASNFGTPGRIANHVYFTGTLDAATWGAELARGEGPGRIFVVEPTGPFEDDPNVTDKKFPGNPTRSYRSRRPLRIVGVPTGWRGHAAEQRAAMKAGIEAKTRAGDAVIDD